MYMKNNVCIYSCNKKKIIEIVASFHFREVENVPKEILKNYKNPSCTFFCIF